jgi:protein gp37
MKRARWIGLENRFLACYQAMVGYGKVRGPPLRTAKRMSQQSSIEWTDATWNPVTGCTKVSPGCDHCYAATFAERWRGIRGHPYENGFDLTLRPNRIEEPLHWKTPRLVFVNSMSDLFHVGVHDDFIVSVFDVMRRAAWHEFQLLTKRPERLLRLSRKLDFAPNVWVGVSVETPKYYWRISMLQQVPAAVRFLSCEPLLEDLPELPLDGIAWVIVGGESGAGARPMAKDWVRSIRRQCIRNSVPFFFKQWGGVRKKAAGRELDGRTYDALPSERFARNAMATIRR